MRDAFYLRKSAKSVRGRNCSSAKCLFDRLIDKIRERFFPSAIQFFIQFFYSIEMLCEFVRIEIFATNFW